MASQLLATKSIAELHEQESSGNQLRRALNATHLTLLGIGGIIGTGIFVLTGTRGRQARRPGDCRCRSSSPASAAPSPDCATRSSPP